MLLLTTEFTFNNRNYTYKDIEDILDTYCNSYLTSAKLSLSLSLCNSDVSTITNDQ